MRNATVATLALGMLLAIVSDGLAQEATAEKSEKTPLQIIDDCVRAIRARDFATYVDHLSKDEQKLQAGYALLMTSEMLPAVEMGSEQIEPEVLLFVRAVGDLVKEHTGDDLGRNGNSLIQQAMNHLLSGQVVAPTYNTGVNYASPQVARVNVVRDVLMNSAETVKDPGSFLIALMTEISRPVQVAGAQPEKHSELPDLLEFVKVYQRQDWTLFTRGDYAIAVPAKRETLTQPSPDVAQPTDVPQPSPDGLQSNASQNNQAPWPLRIEFKKIDGVWKISHVLPISTLTPLTARTASICTGPECNANVTYFTQPAAAPLPVTSFPSHAPAPATSSR